MVAVPTMAMKTSDEYKVKPSIGLLFRFATSLDVVLFCFSALLHTGVGAAMICMTTFYESFFDSAGEASAFDIGMDMDLLWDVVRLMLILGFSVGAMMFFGNVAAALAAANSKAQWKKSSVKAILRQDVGWYDISKPQELATKMAESVTHIHNGMGMQAVFAFQGLGMFASGMTIGFNRSWQIGLVILAVLPCIIILMCIFFIVLIGGAKATSRAYGSAGGLANEVLFSMRTVTSLGLEATFAKRYIEHIQKPLQVGIAISPLRGFMAGLASSSFLLLLGAGFLGGGIFIGQEMDSSSFDYNPTVGGAQLTYCAHANNTPTGVVDLLGTTCPPPSRPWQMNCLMMGIAGTMGNQTLFGSNTTFIQTLGQPNVASFEAYARANVPPAYLAQQPDLLSGCMLSAAAAIIAVFAMMQGGQGVGNFLGGLDPVSKGMVGAATLSEIINRRTKIDAFATTGTIPSSVQGDLEVKDVVFAYPSAPEHLVCKGYSLTIPAGQTVALCGPSGSGKSTIIQLLERFYDPQDGVVMLDGVDIKTLNVKWLRSQLGLVGQEPVLFSGSVADNIQYGKEGATREEIEAAATSANAHTFIMENLANGYDTDVGQGGGKLSGGQKQRVAIARAIIKKPVILLLDEATSALDNESERIVQAALDEIMTKQKRTTVVIAHRLSTIRNADKIAVVREGKVVEEGKVRRT